MQYILTQDEYDEYRILKRDADTTKRKLSSKAQKVFDFYEENIDSTYEKASKVLGIRESAIFYHVKRLIKMGYMFKYSDGKLGIKSDSLNTQ